MCTDIAGSDRTWLAGRLARSFAAVPHRRVFLGPFHRRLLATPEAIRPCDGGGPAVPSPDRRHVVIVDAIVEGRCAPFDTEADLHVPIDLDLARETVVGGLAGPPGPGQGAAPA